jgi:hypothetical protein
LLDELVLDELVGPGSLWAQQLPVHPAPSGRRVGCGHAMSYTISRGTKYGQANLFSGEKPL